MNHLLIHNHREYSYLRAYKGPLQLSRILYKSALFMQNEPKFRKSQMNVNKVLTMNYEKKDTWWTGKKRTQTNPNKPNFRKAKMSLNFYSTKDYENESALRVQENKPNQTQSQNSEIYNYHDADDGPEPGCFCAE